MKKRKELVGFKRGQALFKFLEVFFGGDGRKNLFADLDADFGFEFADAFVEIGNRNSHGVFDSGQAFLNFLVVLFEDVNIVSNGLYDFQNRIQFFFKVFDERPHLGGSEAVVDRIFVRE